MTVLDPFVAASPAHDTPTAEVVAHSFSELEALIAVPRAAGEPLHVLLEGPAAAQIFGEAGAITVSAAVGEAVAR
ncbi:Uncharacterised protein [Mycobacteroides abscessus subsp. massiliense]|uniref:hypothetical protein n=1 Tax=Mycobacteroides abscessus TaxID=36809 RepID=UPI0009A89BF6|nr:hypothetical protein [Mycobacteroides abscessus]SKE70423.1 Uncharacterised protein [Mycobacteroides abscessus subsp. massiliense]SKH80725.1 Uncharacterised protein [Mycobacteroides abscessus subsp. massiliense]SKI34303.1 Uncharacterised protein [Mycobacteroides abscessus subsp. massiliense]SKJ36557.1 Uncharacterised protein [Mycobacteroides abscessus subsp. massiliense]SKK23450.1 Uncharacterised protein [Mycobacteroides abscessus subsp. massiliense]